MLPTRNHYVLLFFHLRVLETCVDMRTSAWEKLCLFDFN